MTAEITRPAEIENRCDGQLLWRVSIMMFLMDVVPGGEGEIILAWLEPGF
jgi:hypothetical protein